MRLYPLLLAVLLLARGAASGHAAPAVDTAELLAAAGVIALGSVGSVSADGARAVVQVDEYYKRGLPQFSLQVGPDCAAAAPPACLDTQARYQAGEQVVLFLRQTAAGWTTVSGTAGKYTVTNGRVLAGGQDQGGLDEFRAQLAQLTGLAGQAAPIVDPTPEVVGEEATLGGAAWLYVAAIVVGIVGLVAMTLLVRSAKRGT